MFDLQLILHTPDLIHMIVFILEIFTKMFRDLYIPNKQGSQSIREIRENYFTFFSSQGIWEKCLKSGKNQGILIGLYIVRVHKNRY